jgi:hypothetical protein
MAEEMDVDIVERMQAYVTLDAGKTVTCAHPSHESPVITREESPKTLAAHFSSCFGTGVSIAHVNHLLRELVLSKAIVHSKSDQSALLSCAVCKVIIPCTSSCLRNHFSCCLGVEVNIGCYRKWMSANELKGGHSLPDNIFLDSEEWAGVREAILSGLLSVSDLLACPAQGCNSSFADVGQLSAHISRAHAKRETTQLS